MWPWITFFGLSGIVAGMLVHEKLLGAGAPRMAGYPGFVVGAVVGRVLWSLFAKDRT